MKLLSLRFLPVRRRHFVFFCPVLFLLLVFFPLLAVAQSQVQANAAVDSPSGFMPGLIHYFAGTGGEDGSYSDGSLPTDVPINPQFVVADSQGNVYIAETSGHVYIVYSGGNVPAALANVTTSGTPATTPIAGRIYQVAGLLAYECGDPAHDLTCGESKPFNKASFVLVGGLAIDAADNLYYSDQADFDNGFIANVVRRVDAKTSIVTTVAGNLGDLTPPADGIIGDDGPATAATLSFPGDLKIDSLGNLFINDYLNDVIRVVYSGSAAPPILAAEGIQVTDAKKGFIYSVAGQPLVYCATVNTCGDGSPAITGASLSSELSMAIDPAGNLFIADTYVPDGSGALGASYIRVVYAGGAVPPLLQLALNPNGGDAIKPSSGFIYPATGYKLTHKYATCSKAPCGDGGIAGLVQFGGDTSNAGNLFLTLDTGGNLYVADQSDFAVRKIDVAGFASTIAGVDDPKQMQPDPAPAPDGFPATSTHLTRPASIAAGPLDPTTGLYDLFLTDTELVWQISPLLSQTINFPTLTPVTYGTGAITLAATASPSGLPITYAVTSGPAHLTGSQLIVTGAGTVVITASQAGNTQYAPAPTVSQSLTVQPATLTVSAQDASKIVGQPNPAFTANFSGFVSTQDTPQNSITGKAEFSTTAVTSSPFGTYPITIGPGSLASTKYIFNFVQGAVLTVTGSTPQTITFPAPPSVVYGASATVTLSATASSKLPVLFTVISGPATNTAGGATLNIQGGGTVVVTASQNGSDIYTAAPPVTQKLVILPAPLTVTGPAVTLPFGTSVQTGSFPAPMFSGFVGGDTASLLVGKPKYSTATGKPAPGTYPITVTKGSLAVLSSAAGSYVLSNFVDGQLTVTAAPQTITLNPLPTAQTYGYAATLTALASSGLPVTFTATGSATFPNGNTTDPDAGVTSEPILFTGVGTVTVTATQAGGGSYTAAAPVTESFTVGKAPLLIAASTHQVREQGAANPIFTYTIGTPPPQPDGFVNGDADVPAVITGFPDLTTVADPSSPPGTYPIVISQGTLSAANYSFIFANGQLTVTPPGSFAITANPASLTIPNGQSGQATLTITPANAYQGTVTLSCGQLPANVSCVVSPATYSFPGSQNPDGSENPAQGTITISASNKTIVGANAMQEPVSRATIFVLPGLMAGLILTFGRRRVGKTGSTIWRMALLFMLGVAGLTITACGGSSKPSSAGSATGALVIMINGSGTSVTGDAAVTSSVPLSVTIQ